MRGVTPTLRNNIFAFGIEGGLARSRDEAHVSFIFERKIVVTKGAPFLTGAWSPGRFKVTGNP